MRRKCQSRLTFPRVGRARSAAGGESWAQVGVAYALLGRSILANGEGGFDVPKLNGFRDSPHWLRGWACVQWTIGSSQGWREPAFRRRERRSRGRGCRNIHVSGLEQDVHYDGSMLDSGRLLRTASSQRRWRMRRWPASGSRWLWCGAVRPAVFEVCRVRRCAGWLREHGGDHLSHLSVSPAVEASG